MKAAIYHEPMKVTMEEVPVPKIGDADILVRVRACGICGSDLHMYRAGFNVYKVPEEAGEAFAVQCQVDNSVKVVVKP